MNQTTLTQLIRKYSLANAVKYQGKANVKAVIGKLFAERPDIREQAQDIISQIENTIKQVNAMTLEEQNAELQSLAPELLAEHREHREKELPPLLDAESGNVVTRLPPEPSGYPHIGHAYAGYINWHYARKYKGSLILRFEDTNPRTVKEEYYEAFREGYRWMDIDWDRELKVSDDIPYFYDRAKDLLQKGEAYLCVCKADTIKDGRRTGTECPHRTTSPEDNLETWDAILGGKYQEGEVVCRLKIDMNHPNAVMRDPNIFRIIEHPHPFQGEKYRLWPTYDFAVAFEDHLNGITHILRSSEFASRGELQAFIRDKFNFPQPRIQEWSRITIEGSPVGKRFIRPLIATKKISGWDDIRLTTIAALRRRGIIPDTIKEFTREIGLSIAQPVIDWSIILGINRRLIDPLANRFYYVNQPREVSITSVEPHEATIPLHPDYPDRGTRIIKVKTRVYIDGNDAELLDRGEIFRLKHLYNLRVDRKTPDILECSYAGEEISQTSKRVQWVTEDSVPVLLRIPDILFIEEKFNPDSLRMEEGIGEKALGTTQRGDLIQLERKGFGRIEQTKEKVIVNMTE